MASAYIEAYDKRIAPRCLSSLGRIVLLIRHLLGCGYTGLSRIDKNLSSCQAFQRCIHTAAAKGTVIGLKNAPKTNFPAEAEEAAAVDMQCSTNSKIASGRVPLKHIKLLRKDEKPIELGEGGFGKVCFPSSSPASCHR